MHFNSFSEFLAMGGYGFYVWLSYGFSLVVLAVLLFISLTKTRKIHQEIIATEQRQQRMTTAKEADLL